MLLNGLNANSDCQRNLFVTEPSDRWIKTCCSLLVNGAETDAKTSGSFNSRNDFTFKSGDPSGGFPAPKACKQRVSFSTGPDLKTTSWN